MLSILNETKTKVFQQEQLTVRIFPSIQEMGSVAAKEVGDQICRLLESKPEINMIFAAAPSQNEFLSHLIHDKRIDWTRINAFHMDEYIGIHPKPHKVLDISLEFVSLTKFLSRKSTI